MKKIKIIQFVSRCILGIVFICASIPKILNPSDFAIILYGYSIFPLSLINIIAILFPFIELICGLSLILGLYYRPSLIIINSIISFFIIIISFNLLRGHEFNCGCFAVGDPSHVSAAGQLLVRNILLLIMGMYLLFNKLSFSYNSKT
ncbi:MAG: DoxX family membrane protein [Desulfobacteraceae bacterium]|nr:DoxX family membrane protein [Desulfobacteraceae bacterium]